MKRVIYVSEKEMIKNKPESYLTNFLAEETSMTDLVIGGHSHTYLEEPIIQNNKAGKQVIVNQAWWGGLVMGKIDFVFERSKKRQKAVFSEII